MKLHVSHPWLAVIFHKELRCHSRQRFKHLWIAPATSVNSSVDFCCLCRMIDVDLMSR